MKKEKQFHGNTRCKKNCGLFTYNPRIWLIVNLTVLFFMANGKSVQPDDSATKPARLDSVQNSVVKVFATVRMPDLFKPWSKQSPQEISGSGVVIEGKRILTNAHMVLYANQIQVQANQSGDKVSATVAAIAPGIDLALLKLDDESFFAAHAPLHRASTLPEVKDAVMTYGFPTGGTGLSITKGIVSRIEFAFYNLSVSGLRIQIDAAINPGNSGGPAVAGNTMIGMAFSRLGGGAVMGDKKIKAIEDFDSRIIGPVLSTVGPKVNAAVLADHPVPVRTGRHTRNPVPVAVRIEGNRHDGVMQYDEVSCLKGRLGHRI